MEKISEINRILKGTKETELSDMINRYASDTRSGVVKLLEKYKKKILLYENEIKRTELMWDYERKYAEYVYIGGVDEVGRGPLAGPVVACTVILPKDCKLLYINDSKQLSEKKREVLYEEIMKTAVAVGLGVVSHERIDQINILNATYEAMQQSVAGLSVLPDLLLADAVTIPGLSMKQVSIIKGDAKSISIAAASIVAKVERDRMMAEYEKEYPGYGFASNKGYGCESHMAAIKELGPSPIHRKSFIKNIISMG